jgi:hypothetical protein
MHTWRRRKETLGVLGDYAKRHKNVYTSVNNNTNFKKIVFFLSTLYGMDWAEKSSHATVPLK